MVAFAYLEKGLSAMARVRHFSRRGAGDVGIVHAQSEQSRIAPFMSDLKLAPGWRLTETPYNSCRPPVSGGSGNEVSP